MTPLKYLFKPIKIGAMEVKNRLVMPPMGINFGVDEAGNVTDQLTEYFAVRARGGTGMLIVGGGAVHPTGLDLPNLPPLWDDKYIPALMQMTGKVHRSDVKFGMQLLHGGRQCYHGKGVAPSPLAAEGVVKGVPKELSLPEIKEIETSFGDSARRCRDAGFDFVEIHGAHGYLVTEFLAGNSNKRQDEYGGIFENRIRFLLQILKDIKRKTGPGFPVGIRINGDDYVKNGWTLDETRKLAPILEAEGADYLHITAGIYGSYPPGISVPSMYAEPGCFVHLAEAVKQEVSIPVIAVGRINDPEQADRILREGKADMVSMGRAHLADPEIANKARSGNAADIRPCIGCCLGCIETAFKLLEGATCVMNPEVGRESQLKGTGLAAVAKKILVVGAGPAGMAVSRLAAMRGHRVLLSDEKKDLGGMLRLAAICPGRSDFMSLIQYYQRELQKLRVEIRLNATIDDALLDSFKPDSVVLATGSIPEIPQLNGLFDTEMKIHTVVDVLEETTTVGERIIILGGNQVGLQVADFLAQKGKKVTVLHRGGHFAMEMASNDRVFLRERLKRVNVTLYKNVSIRQMLPSGIVFQSKEKAHTLQDFDDLIISVGMRSVRAVANLLSATDAELHIIGDAKSPRYLLYSQIEADALGRSL
jgi:2,4-dienoyl-CoA reductase-like NADH-dependent reductase (Old Yellow Enzyme family)/thioredoxin reductase